MKKERTTIKNKLGETLVGELDDIGSAKLVILCHGFQSSKEDRTLVNLSTALLTEGLCTFRFDFSGNGESDGQFLYGNYWKEVEDLRAVVLYFKGRGKKLNTLIGHSKGGNVVLLYSSKYQDIDTVISISARFSLNKGIEDRLGKDFMHKINNGGFIDVKDKYGRLLYRVTRESLLDRLHTDMKAASLVIPKNCRVLILHGTKDEKVPVQDAFEFAKSILTHSLCIIDEADHNFTDHQNDVATIVLNFMRSRCKSTLDTTDSQESTISRTSPFPSRL